MSNKRNKSFGLAAEFKPPGQGGPNPDSPGNARKKQRMNELGPPPLSGYGDTIVASNRFDDTPSHPQMGHMGGPGMGMGPMGMNGMGPGHMGMGPMGGMGMGMNPMGPGMNSMNQMGGNIQMGCGIPSPSFNQNMGSKPMPVSAGKVQNCVDTINRILENVIQHPTEEKYRKIRVMSTAFQEKVYYMEGSNEFLMAAGFQLVQLPGPDGNDEDYYVLMDFDEEKKEFIMMLREALNNGEVIRPELDRSLRVLFPAGARRKTELPDEFYDLTAEELKKEQELRKHVVEQELMLRTKAMREREAQREKRRYRYTLIRIRFPDEIILQGTFKVNEKLRDVTSFIQEALEEPLRPFVLSFLGKKLVDQDVSLLDLELIPSVTLHFNWDQPCAESETSFLKETILALLENV